MDLSFDRIVGLVGLGLGVLGIIIGIGVAVAMDPKSKGEMTFSIVCFVFSGVVLCLTVGVWAFMTNISTAKRILVAAPAFALISISMVEASRWAQSRYHPLQAEQGSADKNKPGTADPQPPSQENKRKKSKALPKSEEPERYLLPIDLPNTERNLFVDTLKAVPAGTKVGVIVGANGDSECADSGDLLGKLFVRGGWIPYFSSNSTSKFVSAEPSGTVSYTEPLACFSDNPNGPAFKTLIKAFTDVKLRCTTHSPAFGMFLREGVGIEIVIQPKHKKR